MAHSGKLETGHKWTTWDVKWENCIVCMVGVYVIPLYYMTHWDMATGWTASSEHDCLKYQSMHIGP